MLIRADLRLKICENQREPIKINFKCLFCFFLVVGAARIVLTAAAAETTCSYQDKNAQEQETIRNEKEVEETSDTKEFGTCEETDDAAQHQQAAENPGSPAEIIDDFAKFHIDWF
jgi:hypothetical protein